MTSDSRRLAILTAREIHDLYGLPCFTEQERCVYFDLSPAEHDAVEAVHTDAAAVHLVLQLGYFKAKRQFFTYLAKSRAKLLGFAILLAFFRDRGRFPRAESEIDRNSVEELAWQLNLTDPNGGW